MKKLLTCFICTFDAIKIAQEFFIAATYTDTERTYLHVAAILKILKALLCTA
jgi:hypothetical protein